MSEERDHDEIVLNEWCHRCLLKERSTCSFGWQVIKMMNTRLKLDINILIEFDGVIVWIVLKLR